MKKRILIVIGLFFLQLHAAEQQKKVAKIVLDAEILCQNPACLALQRKMIEAKGRFEAQSLEIDKDRVENKDRIVTMEAELNTEKQARKSLQELYAKSREKMIALEKDKEELLARLAEKPSKKK